MTIDEQKYMSRTRFKSDASPAGGALQAAANRDYGRFVIPLQSSRRATDGPG